jgi:hypothetical protein
MLFALQQRVPAFTLHFFAPQGFCATCRQSLSAIITIIYIIVLFSLLFRYACLIHESLCGDLRKFPPRLLRNERNFNRDYKLKKKYVGRVKIFLILQTGALL